jgi:hypothetical protein
MTSVAYVTSNRLLKDRFLGTDWYKMWSGLRVMKNYRAFIHVPITYIPLSSSLMKYITLPLTLCRWCLLYRLINIVWLVLVCRPVTDNEQQSMDIWNRQLCRHCLILIGLVNTVILKSDRVTCCCRYRIHLYLLDQHGVHGYWNNKVSHCHWSSTSDIKTLVCSKYLRKIYSVLVTLCIILLINNKTSHICNK